MRQGNLSARACAMLVCAAGAVVGLPTAAAAQYFGRNKVQYESFRFRVLRTPHFEIYYYPAESVATADAARMAERWYVRHSAVLKDQFARKPMIFYADQPDFQQTNVVGGFIEQGTGGVTEGLRSRVVLPFTGVYADNDHVIGHELVHVFQYNIAESPKSGGSLANLNRLPLWLIEGMAEYLSLGREDANTAMWLRDAALRNDLPSIRKLSTDPRYFPYRYGQALWAFIGGQWGDNIITTLYRNALRMGWEPAVRRVLALSSDTLSRQWLASIRSTYTPLMQGRTNPRDEGKYVLARAFKTGDMDVSPTLSPDGKHVAFYSRRGLFNIDLYVADAQTGEIVKKLTSPNRDSHIDALSFISSAGSWSPDAKKLAFPVYKSGDNQIAIFDVASRNIERTVNVPGVGGINDVAWGPDGRIAFSGLAGGISDLYILDVKSGKVQQLTHDRFADLQPAWSPDGRTIAFATDRGGTDLNRLSYGRMQIALFDVTTGNIRLLSLFERAKHINPQFSPDGRDVYFISDRGGFPDIYRTSLEDGSTFQVTRLATGVSGITAISPALSVARESGRLVFSVFENAGYSLHRLEPEEARGEPLTPTGTAVASMLPPVQAGEDGGVITAQINDPNTGLPAPQQYPVSAYHPSLKLDYVGAPGVGVAFGGPFGTGLAGGFATYFSDMLGNDVLTAGIGGSGSIKDFGGQVAWQNLSHRWNWGAAVSHIPYLINAGIGIGDTTLSTNVGNVNALVYDQFLVREYVEQGALFAQYPFSMTRRFEVSAGVNRIHYGVTSDRFIVVGNTVVDASEVDLPAPPGFTFFQSSAALVGDYSYFGFTSPVAGGRYRFEVSPLIGDLKMYTLLGDYRRYFFARPFTFAFRALSYGRYGKDAEQLSPLFLGDEYLIRGYSAGSFDTSECPPSTSTTATCPVIERLIGSRLGVANVELRVPLFGTSEYGLINLPFLPTEIAPFFDAGVAWTRDQSPTFEFRRRTSERVPVFSTGVSARMNLLGYVVLEFYYAHPFQRPDKGNVWGFQILPGW